MRKTSQEIRQFRASMKRRREKDRTLARKSARLGKRKGDAGIELVFSIRG